MATPNRQICAQLMAHLTALLGNSYSAIGASITPSAPHAHGLPGPQPAPPQSPLLAGWRAFMQALRPWAHELGERLLGIRSLLGTRLHDENPTKAQMLSPGRVQTPPA